MQRTTLLRNRRTGLHAASQHRERGRHWRVVSHFKVRLGGPADGPGGVGIVPTASDHTLILVIDDSFPALAVRRPAI